MPLRLRLISPAIPQATAEPATKADRYHNHWITKSMGESSSADYDFDAAILGATRLRAIVGDGAGRTKPLDGHTIAADTMGDKEISDSLGSRITQRNVEAVVTRTVGVAVDRGVRTRTSVELGRDLSQGLFLGRGQGKDVLIEGDRSVCCGIDGGLQIGARRSWR